MLSFIVGTRPNFVKHAALNPKLKRDNCLIHTGQHYDYNLSDEFFSHLIKKTPNINLSISQGTDCSQLSRMIEALEKTFIDIKASAVVVYGDTNTTLAAALVANKLHIPLIHIEAGVRHYHRHVPEENNRVLIDQISDLLFCPTKQACENLKKEGVLGKIEFSGDLQLDLFKDISKHIRAEHTLRKFSLKEKKYIVLTIHRQSNVDDYKRLKSIVSSLTSLDIDVIFPAHPRAVNNLKKHKFYDVLQQSDNIKLVEPIPYQELLSLIAKSHCVITDSGGVPKEAYFSSVPCITLRDYTAWPETIADGWNYIIDPLECNLKDILSMLPPKGEPDISQFGDGNAAEFIAQSIDKFLG